MLAQARSHHPHRPVLEAFDRLLREEHAFLAAAKIPSPTSAWQQAALVMIAKALQQQQVVLDSVSLGYADELSPVARALLSTVMSLTFLLHGTSHTIHERKAVQYFTGGAEARRRLLKYLVRSRWLTGKAAKEHDLEATADEDAFREAETKLGYPPLRVGPKKKYWSGYDDATLFRKMKSLRWYHHYYGPWSEALHGGTRGVIREIEQLGKHAFDIGPRGDDPWFLMLGCGLFGVEALSQINKAYRLRKKAELQAMSRRFQDAMSAARTVSPPLP